MSGWPQQQAVYSRLTGDATLMALISKVYDHVEQDAVFPYVVIGETTESPWDTDDSTGSEDTVTIHIWSRYRGRKEVKQIQQRIYTLLHRHDLDVAGYHTVTVEFEYADTMLDPDGITRHGVQRFRIITEST